MAAVDWTQVLIAMVAAVPATAAATLGYLTRRQIRTPSGDTIGQVVEKTLDLTSADLAMTTRVHKRITEPDGRDE